MNKNHLWSTTCLKVNHDNTERSTVYTANSSNMRSYACRCTQGCILYTHIIECPRHMLGLCLVSEYACVQKCYVFALAHVHTLNLCCVYVYLYYTSLHRKDCWTKTLSLSSVLSAPEGAVSLEQLFQSLSLALAFKRGSRLAIQRFVQQGEWFIKLYQFLRYKPACLHKTLVGQPVTASIDPRVN